MRGYVDLRCGSVGACRLVIAMAVMAFAVSGALAGEEAAPPDFKRPSYKTRRQDEDWSVLAGLDTSETGDLFDPIKYVPLNDEGTVWVSFGGQLRERVEIWRDFNFGFPAAADHDDSFLLSRLFLHADVHLGDRVRVFVQSINALATDRDLVGGRRTLDVNSFDIHQAFLDVKVVEFEDGDLTIRAGRQELLFGKQRLVSPLNWSNTRRRFQGVSAILRRADWTVTGFYTQFVPVRKYDMDVSNSSVNFGGVYAEGKVPNSDVGLDLYALFVDRNGVAFNGTAGSEDRWTVGARVHGKIADTSFDYDAEGAYQFGKVGSGDISAFMFAGELGHTWRDCNWKPRAHLGAGYASGDDNAGGNVGTFNQLFPLGHAYLGYIDAIGRQNLIDVNTGIAVKPTKQTTVKLAGHAFWRADNDDAVYNAGGAVLRPGAADNSGEIGQEVDLTVKHVFNRHISLLVGYSHFFPGDVIEGTGPHSSIDFGYTALQFTF